MSRASRIARVACSLAGVALALSLVHGAQSAPAPTRPAIAQDDLRERAVRALSRDPRTLSLSDDSRWSKWGPKDPIAPELQPDVGAGMRAYAAQDYAASLAFFYGVLDRERDFPPALYQGGLCYFRLRRYSDAAAMLERFVRAAPQEIGATQALGHCYYSLGDFERARAHYETVLARSPSSPEAIRGLALSVLRLGDQKRALELLARVLELRPDHADAHAWCAQILFDEGDSEAALIHAERVRDLEPWDPRGWFLLSRIYGELGHDKDADQARERFESASRIEQGVRQQEGLLLHDPSRAEVWVQLIALRRASGNREAVRSAIDHLVALSPRDPRAALLVVDVFEWLGEKERAKQAALHAESVAGSDKQTWNWLADFYRRVLDPVGAERATKAAAAGR